MHIYNCHTHIFNLDCAPKHFLDGFVNKIGASILRGMLAIPVIKKVGLALAGKFPFAAKHAALVSIGTELSQVTIFEQKLQPHYPEGTRFIVLAINFDYMGAGPAKLNYRSQLWQLLEVRKRNPNTCLPFIAVDPRIGSAEENLVFVKRWTEEIPLGVGLKMYPALGFYPFDSRLDRVYEYAEKNGLPIMVHCTKGGIYFRGSIADHMRLPEKPQAISSQLNRQDWLYGKIPPLRASDSKNKETADAFCDFFLDPRAYDLVLARFPKLKICFAHYGGSDEMQAYQEHKSAPSSEPPTNWHEGVRWLMRKYPNVYTDLSYTLADYKMESLVTQLETDLNVDSVYRHRILFGTDFFMVERVKSEAILAAELMKELSKVSAEGWQLISNSNPQCYLHSAFYRPVELPTEADAQGDGTTMYCQKDYEVESVNKEPGLKLEAKSVEIRQ